MILKALGREAKTPKGRRPVRDQRGTISMGHPIGASGARVALHLPLELGRRGGGLGAAGLCGGGQGWARLGCAAAAARARRRCCASAADEPYRVEPEK